MTRVSIDDVRADRLAALALREAADREAAAADAACDLPVLDNVLAVVEGKLAEADAELTALGDLLIRKASAGGHSLTQQIGTLTLLRGNLKVIADAMKADATVIAGG